MSFMRVVYGCRLSLRIQIDGQRGIEYDHMVSAMDILPTSLKMAHYDLAGISTPLDGVNLDPYLRGVKTDPTTRRSILAGLGQ